MIIWDYSLFQKLNKTSSYIYKENFILSSVYRVCIHMCRGALKYGVNNNETKQKVGNTYTVWEKAKLSAGFDSVVEEDVRHLISCASLYRRRFQLLWVIA